MVFTGKTAEEAINEGLQTLGLTKENADVVIIKEEKQKGFFGRAKTIVTVSVQKKDEEMAELEKQTETKKEKKTDKEPKKVTEKKVKKQTNDESAKNAEKFVKELLTKLDIEADVNLKDDEKDIVIEVKSKDTSLIIGHRGEILDSIQALAGAIANIGKKEYVRVVVDCENYREKREDVLVALAKRLANKSIEKGKRIALEPMNAYERRVIHTALAEIEGVKSVSEGEGANRYVMIVPNEIKDNRIEHEGRNNRRTQNNRRNNGKRPYKKDFKGDRPKREVKTIDTKVGFGVYLGNSKKQ